MYKNDEIPSSLGFTANKIDLFDSRQYFLSTTLQKNVILHALEKK